MAVYAIKLKVIQMPGENAEYECPACSAMVDSYSTACPHCGYEFGSDDEFDDEL